MEAFMSNDVIQIIRGMIIGIIYSVSGWMKDKKGSEAWNWKKVWPNMMLGAVGGWMAESTGISMEDAMKDSGVLGFVAVSQNLIKSFPSNK